VKAPDWNEIRGRLWERCGGLCEVSGLALDPDTFDAHHRRNKGMGGTSRDDRDAIYNLLALDPQVHNGGVNSVHGRRQWSEDRGYLVPKTLDYPGSWPVLLRGRWLVLLGSNGRYCPVPRW
jgi:hypothetical protein